MLTVKQHEYLSQCHRRWNVKTGATGSGKSYLDITADHTIVVTAASSATIYAKVNDSWTPFTKAYKKGNGVWVEQTDIANLFDPTTNYKRLT